MSGVIEKIRALPGWACLALAFAPVAFFAAMALPLAEFSPVAFKAVAALLVASSLFFSFQWWFTLDEVSQEAHKFAWFWGGSLGLCIAAASLILLVEIPSLAHLVERLSAIRPELGSGSVGFAHGILFCCLAQVLGYTLVWAGWWMRRWAPR